jgi:hypothetical protein
LLKVDHLYRPLFAGFTPLAVPSDCRPGIRFRRFVRENIDLDG